ncbi:MAG: hypothetical protein HY537_14565 [Deltaproteobacteria bacterium]|nr:hypothetical protein [Deltaproteobacteria bacterium]
MMKCIYQLVSLLNIVGACFFGATTLRGERTEVAVNFKDESGKIFGNVLGTLEREKNGNFELIFDLSKRQFSLNPLKNFHVVTFEKENSLTLKLAQITELTEGEYVYVSRSSGYLTPAVIRLHGSSLDITQTRDDYLISKFEAPAHLFKARFENPERKLVLSPAERSLDLLTADLRTTNLKPADSPYLGLNKPPHFAIELVEPRGRKMLPVLVVPGPPGVVYAVPATEMLGIHKTKGTGTLTVLTIPPGLLQATDETKTFQQWLRQSPSVATLGAYKVEKRDGSGKFQEMTVPTLQLDVLPSTSLKDAINGKMAETKQGTLTAQLASWTLSMYESDAPAQTSPETTGWWKSCAEKLSTFIPFLRKKK